MRLSDLNRFNNITLQCHNNPDPDAIASAYGLYLYFREQGRSVGIIYGGRNEIQKSNLVLLLKEFKVPIKHITDEDRYFEGLLVTVDCQEGESNVAPFRYDELAIIDHHQSGHLEGAAMDMTEIRPELGSCSTLVWHLLTLEGFDLNKHPDLSTMLYYGLMTDTSNFSEMKHPLDRDMRDSLYYDNSLITRLNNSNISLKELEITGVALIRHTYDPEQRYAVIHSRPCDPNILGVIADFLQQVDVIDICVVFNETTDGYKISVRSCIKEVHADELADHLTLDAGSGGGHKDKAGGFIPKIRLKEKYGDMEIDQYISSALRSYLSSFEVIYAKDFRNDLKGYGKYISKPVVTGVVDPMEFWDVGTPMIIRTMQGDININVDNDSFIMVGIEGEVYPMEKAKFAATYEIVDLPCDIDSSYKPTVRNRITGEMKEIVPFIRPCRSLKTSYIYAKRLDNPVKIFTAWDEENYMLGKAGDYIAARADDIHDIYVMNSRIFEKCCEEILPQETADHGRSGS